MKQLQERMLSYTIKHMQLNEAVYSDIPEKASQAIQYLELIYDDLCNMSRDGDPGASGFKYYREHFDFVIKYLKGFTDNYQHLLNNGKVEEQLKSSNVDYIVSDLERDGVSYKRNENEFVFDTYEEYKRGEEIICAAVGYNYTARPKLFSITVEEELTESTSSEFVPDTVNLNEPNTKVDVPSGEAIESTASQGLAAILIQAITDEWDTISEYNTLIANAEAEGYNDIAQVIRDINEEENIHVGQLQAALETLSSQTKQIDQGEQEGQEQLIY